MIETLATATKKQLRNRSWLEDAIIDAGIYGARDYPEDGEPDPDGCAIWQYEREFAPYLIALSKLKITSYIEVGLWYGGSFIFTIEYLQRFGLTRAMGIDPRVKETVHIYAKAQHDGVSVEIVEDASDSPLARMKMEEFRPDLVFIDGDHSRGACRRDWKIAKSVARYVAFHDIHWQGVWDVWSNISGNGSKREWWDEERVGSGLGLVKV